MTNVPRRIAVAAIAGAMVLASTTMTAGTASAVGLSCNAPSGYNCLGIDNATPDAHSFRRFVPGGGSRCLTRHVPGRTKYHRDVHIPRNHIAFLTPYKQDDCKGPRYSNWNSEARVEGRWLIQRMRG